MASPLSEARKAIQSIALYGIIMLMGNCALSLSLYINSPDCPILRFPRLWWRLLYNVYSLFFAVVVHSFPYGHAHSISIHMAGGVIHLHINLSIIHISISIPIYIYKYREIYMGWCFDLFGITCALLFAHLTQFVMQILWFLFSTRLDAFFSPLLSEEPQFSRLLSPRLLYCYFIVLSVSLSLLEFALHDVMMIRRKKKTAHQNSEELKKARNSPRNCIKKSWSFSIRNKSL